MKVLHRLLALSIGLLLVGGNAAVCVSLAQTSEARMACCVDADCPMHQGESHHGRSSQPLTQAEADACCTVSGRDQPNQSSAASVAAISVAVLGNGAIVPPRVPQLVLSDGWRTAAPRPITPVARHVLLSVFLV